MYCCSWLTAVLVSKLLPDQCRAMKSTRRLFDWTCDINWSSQLPGVAALEATAGLPRGNPVVCSWYHSDTAVCTSTISLNAQMCGNSSGCLGPSVAGYARTRHGILLLSMQRRPLLGHSRTEFPCHCKLLLLVLPKDLETDILQAMQPEMPS